MLFKPKCPIAQDEWDWLLAGFKWLDKEFGADSERKRNLHMDIAAIDLFEYGVTAYATQPEPPAAR
ncbi:hypothetical protein ACR9YC_03440 [Parasphingorhabdus sp. DH2-15]|uniref:hypothetical protein n=1 Tax=Parasphingorhabdus sp. DH2-15 TaxID=3444112 RepID=UPI003F6854A6